MALPTPEKTWNFSHVVPTPTGSRQGDVASLLFEIKEALLALPQPFTVAGSSDGVTAGMDEEDRITDRTKINFTGGVGWWIVLQAPAGWNGGQLLLWTDAGGAFSVNTHTKFSLSGAFTGGSTSAAPTATDEDQHINDEIVDSNVPGTGGQFTAHIMQSSDGQHTRIYTCSLGRPSNVIVFETAGSPGSAWVDPRFYGRGPVFIRETPAALGLTPVVGNGSRKWLRMKNPTTGDFISPYFLFPVAGQRNVWDSLTLTTPNQISGEYPLWNLGLVSNTDSGNATHNGLRGRLGQIKDWWISVSAVNPGDAFPGDGSKTHMAIGAGIIVPWDGTTPDFG